MQNFELRLARDWYKSKTLLLVSLPAVIAVIERGITQHQPWYSVLINVCIAIAPSTLRDTIKKGIEELAQLIASLGMTVSSTKQTVSDQIIDAKYRTVAAINEHDSSQGKRHKELLAHLTDTVGNVVRENAHLTYKKVATKPKKTVTRKSIVVSPEANETK